MTLTIPPELLFLASLLGACTAIDLFCFRLVLDPPEIMKAMREGIIGAGCVWAVIQTGGMF